MHVKRLKIIRDIDYKFPTCFSAKAPSSGNSRYRGEQYQRNILGVKNNKIKKKMLEVSSFEVVGFRTDGS